MYVHSIGCVVACHFAREKSNGEYSVVPSNVRADYEIHIESFSFAFNWAGGMFSGLTWASHVDYNALYELVREIMRCIVVKFYQIENSCYILKLCFILILL